MILSQEFFSVKFIGSDPSELFISTFVSLPADIVLKQTAMVAFIEFGVQYFSDKCAFVCGRKPKQHQNHPNQTNPKGIIKRGQEVVKGSLSRCFSVIGCPRTFWGN